MTKIVRRPKVTLIALPEAFVYYETEKCTLCSLACLSYFSFFLLSGGGGRGGWDKYNKVQQKMNVRKVVVVFIVVTS